MNSLTNRNASPSEIKEGDLRAYYQPIIALETRSVVGYESLGRLAEGGSVRSLGPFFTDDSIPVREHVRVDRLLREQAFAKLGATPNPPMLFVNLKPSWIYEQFKQAGELHTLQLLDKYGIPPNRICIEITEEEFKGSMYELGEIINLYREAGCQIAIDDIGTGFSNFDRIALIQPNLLKVDVHLMKKSASHNGYLGALRSFSSLAEQIGASLLIEGVESEQDLKRAVQIGARYVQGYLFSPAVPEFYPRDAFTSLIESELSDNRKRIRESISHWDDVGRELIETVRRSDFGDLSSLAEPDRADRVIEQLLPSLDNSCLRVYICDNDGVQLSSNYSRTEKQGWRVEKQYRNADWSWRPYFVPHLSHERSRVEAKLSLRYSDLDTHAWIRTVSIPLGPSVILLMDVADHTNL
ncbi:EAL domain-containing protein [Cohnella suwonensis]|uniref:EAL domain-containing protein n=1 Tax=Cohnella suwonensis TaxID=696072 RepID=A0ABW0LP23_9BACL